MTGFCCPVCNGDMHEELYEPIAWCDTCRLIIRTDGSWAISGMDVVELELDDIVDNIVSQK